MDLVNLIQSMSINDTEDKSDSSFNVFAANINNVHTDIVIGEFSNKCMVIATQYQKIGSLLKVTVDQPENNLDITEPVYSVNLLFGSDDIEQQAAARYIAEKLNINKPLMLFLCLKEYSPGTVRFLAEALVNIPTKDC